MTTAAAVTETPPLIPSSSAEKRALVETVLGDILKHMQYPARMEMKDMADGGIGVALHFETELPGIVGNKRSYLVDCLQFLVNKVVNRPNMERRWVSLGVNAFPEPRPVREPGAPREPAAAPVAKATAPAQQPAKAPRGKPAVAAASPAASAPPKRQNEPASNNDERSMTVEPSAAMTRLATSLAQKSAVHGRFYGVMLLEKEDRARTLAAASKVPGTSLKAEGEGHWRRVAFVPAKPTVMVKKQVMPDYDEDDDG